MNRALTWIGTAVFLISTIALAIYLTRIGLDRADKVASVLGLFVSLSGLAIAVCGATGVLGSRRSQRSDSEQKGNSISIKGNNSGIAVAGDENITRQKR